MNTLDTFAAHAMQALLTNVNYSEDRTTLAADAYWFAEAMMNERTLRQAERISNDTRRISENV